MSNRRCPCGFRGEFKNVGRALYPFCGDSSNRYTVDVKAANGSRLRRSDGARVSTGISPGYTLGDALWLDSHDSQPVLQNAWGIGATPPKEPHISKINVDHQ